MQQSDQFPSNARMLAVGQEPPLVQTHRQDRLVSWLFIAPALIFLLITSVYPLLYSLRLSFYSWNMTVPNSQPVWVGFRNYTRIFADKDFLASVRVTLIFVATSVTIEFVLGMALALLATSRIKAIGLIR